MEGGCDENKLYACMKFSQTSNAENQEKCLMIMKMLQSVNIDFATLKSSAYHNLSGSKILMGRAEKMNIHRGNFGKEIRTI